MTEKRQKQAFSLAHLMKRGENKVRSVENHGDISEADGFPIDSVYKEAENAENN